MNITTLKFIRNKKTNYWEVYWHNTKLETHMRYKCIVCIPNGQYNTIEQYNGVLFMNEITNASLVFTIHSNIEVKTKVWDYQDRILYGSVEKI
jgi:hypothetical protein